MTQAHQHVQSEAAPSKHADRPRGRFDIEFGLSDGTTYNAYLIFGADKTALVETSHEKFR